MADVPVNWHQNKIGELAYKTEVKEFNAGNVLEKLGREGYTVPRLVLQRPSSRRNRYRRAERPPPQRGARRAAGSVGRAMGHAGVAAAAATAVGPIAPAVAAAATTPTGPAAPDAAAPATAAVGPIAAADTAAATTPTPAL